MHYRRAGNGATLQTSQNPILKPVVRPSVTWRGSSTIKAESGFLVTPQVLSSRLDFKSLPHIDDPALWA